MKPDAQQEQGFTLIEVMITMVIALVVLGGMSSLFVAQTRTANMLNQKSQAMNDLFLASQMMQFELRKAKAICWSSVNKTIYYQPLTSSIADNLTAACNAPAVTAAANGSFQGRAPTVDIPSSYICWDRPNDNGNCQELLRGMNPATGVVVTPPNTADLQAVRTVTLTSQYMGKNNNIKDLSLSFKVWPRNTQ
ncbi:MAG: type II secretion system protein [Ghiorsea sp.]